MLRVSREGQNSPDVIGSQSLLANSDENSRCCGTFYAKKAELMNLAFKNV